MGKRVPPAGPKNAKLVFVGEAPGRIEVVEGKPFVGPAGNQFNKMLDSAGITRSEVYITNVIKEQVPDGDAKDAYFFRKKQPTQAYMDGILELLGELSELRAAGGAWCVVPMGNYALWALTQKMGISNWRGSIIESTLMPGLKLVPTIHPSFYIQNGGYNSNKEPLGIWDFTRAQEESLTPGICLATPEFVLDPSSEEIDRGVERLLRAEFMVVDTEWYGPERLAYIGFADEKLDWAICIPATNMRAFRAYKELLTSRVPKIIQNRSFDTLALHRQGITIEDPIEDTMIAWHACWGDIGEKRLATITSVLTRIPFYKEEGEYVQPGDQRGQIYNCWDCVGEAEAWKKLRDEEMPYVRAEAGYDISRRLAPIMDEAARVGLRADVSKMRALAEDYLMKADLVEKVLADTIGHSLNCRSSQQVIKLVYEELGVKRQVKTSKQEVLMDIAAASKDEAIKAVLTAVIRVRQNQNIVSRYLNVDNAVDKDGRIRTNWNLAGTRGGARLSATIFGRGEQRWFPSVPMQTIPEDARVCYVADPGCVFVGWDLEQAEARVVAVKTRDYELLEDMDRGIDIHLKLAAAMPFGKTYDQLVAMVAAAAKNGKGKDSVVERYLTKKCRHSLNYVGGPGTLKSTVNKYYLDTGVGIGDGDAKRLRDAYIKLTPGLEIWWNEVKSLAWKSPRQMENYFGRVHQFLGWFTDDLHREMVAYEPQANVADLTSVGMIEAYPRIKRLDPKAFFLSHLHDGGFLQVREDLSDETCLIIKECMTKEIIIDRMPITIPVEIKRGPTWADLEKVTI